MHPIKLLVIIGPTSSGKSELAVKLAGRFDGEIISCDSRQIYRGMNLGTGKVPGKWISINFGGRQKRKKNIFIYKNIPHCLIDFADPKKQYSAALFQERAQKAIGNIAARGKLPILCGGAAHWIDAVVHSQRFPDVKPNPKLRAKLEKQSSAILYQRLVKLDPARAKTIDRFNKRRLIRALEIVITTGKPVPALMRSSPYNLLWLGINQPQDVLYKKIEKRLRQRLKAGMIKEVRRLHRQGVSWKRLYNFGLEYRYVSLYLQKEISYQEMLAQLPYAIKHYSKRQMTWWKRNKNIRWIHNFKAANKLAAKFYKKK